VNDALVVVTLATMRHVTTGPSITGEYGRICTSCRSNALEFKNTAILDSHCSMQSTSDSQRFISKTLTSNYSSGHWITQMAVVGYYGSLDILLSSKLRN